MLGLIFAFLSALFYALSNITDKYIIGRHVKDVLAFTSVTGFVSVLFGGLLAVFLNWSGVSIAQFILPAIVGILMGAQFFVYMLALEREDVSYVVGLAYVYPVIVAVLAYAFIHERISAFGYAGIAITLLGVLLLSVRLHKIKWRVAISSVIAIIILAAVAEFLVKVSTIQLGIWQGIAISTITTGLTMLCGLFWRSIRKNARAELRNYSWAFLSDLTLFLAIGTTFFAMEELPAAIVSAIASVQPLLVLLMERIIHARTGDLSRDELLMPKFTAISVIVVGVTLLSLAA